jgi:Protein of unknown function (DUF1688)
MRTTKHHNNMTPPPSNEPAAELVRLRSAAAVRERCEMVYRFVAEGRSQNFSVDERRLPAVAEYVAKVTRETYPDLKIPYHSRWRHFDAGGVNRWEELVGSMRGDVLERARAAVDLVTVSVLLDAGAGTAWRYREMRTGASFTRSEGLAIASLDMFRAGGFSSDMEQPWRVDAIALMQMDTATLARHFQVEKDNPLLGLEGRTTLLRRLGVALAADANLFGRAPARPGHLLDCFMKLAANRHIRAGRVLAAVLDGLASIWPSGLDLDGFVIGDAGRHRAARTDDASDGIVPFHKLSQWLTYSLLEPLMAVGLMVDDIHELTALAEYRNGGLLVDLEAIVPRSGFDPQREYAVDSEMVVEWRALTVALMDRLIDFVRAQLGMDATFTLPQMLQGGTWTAGRKIARELRPLDGASPIRVAADGTVF